MCEIRIGGEEAEFLSITLIGRSHPHCRDYWDGNWLRAKIQVAAGGFCGHVDADLRTEEIRDFCQGLTSLHSNLAGDAVFHTMERWLTILATGDGRGHMRFECDVRDDAGAGNLLHCTLELDQTYLHKTLRQLEAAVRQFPVIGRP